ncbi:hypothetical protein E3N88_35184 [Mikania micrantha]|uniref:Uncharacterized protein n=1 Tax=Mikania micrantha TaxID=192012 RepID=A0A5N6M087_9ASTR|nr:hypothetical protein E3N88_35184 [Mikania micrantha]
MEPRIQQSPSGTKSPSRTSDQVTMEDSTQAETSISMEPVSPLGTTAEETLSSIPEFSKDTTMEPSKVVGQLEEAVNAKVNSGAAAASEGPVIFEVTSSEEPLANEPTSEATGSISSGLNKTDEGKRKLTLEEEAEQEERRVPKKKGRPDTSLDGEILRLSGLLQEKGFDQLEQAAAASKVATVLTKKQKETAYREKMKKILVNYGFSRQQLSPMKNSTMDMHLREIKKKIAKGELPSMKQIQAQRESLNLGFGGRIIFDTLFSGSAIR